MAIGWQSQDSSGSICEERLGGAWRIIFTHEFALMSPDLKFIESLWHVRRLYRELDIKNWCTSWWK